MTPLWSGRQSALKIHFRGESWQVCLREMLMVYQRLSFAFFSSPQFFKNQVIKSFILEAFQLATFKKKKIYEMNVTPRFLPPFSAWMIHVRIRFDFVCKIQINKRKKSHNEPHDLQIFRKKTHMTWLCGLLPTNSQSFCLHRDCLIGFLSYYSTVSLSPHQQNWAPFVS